MPKSAINPTKDGDYLESELSACLWTSESDPALADVPFDCTTLTADYDDILDKFTYDDDDP